MPASGLKKFGVVIFAALGAIVMFIIFSPKNQFSVHEGDSHQSDGQVPDGPPPSSTKENAPVAQQSKVPVANALDSDVTLDVNVTSNGQKPILNIKTNLPPQTILNAQLIRPTNQGGESYISTLSSAVQADYVDIGPFLKSGATGLSPGIYVVYVSTAWDEQPKEVFGVNGEKLTGRHVFAPPGIPTRTVFQEFKFEMNSDGSINNPPSEINQDGSVYKSPS